MFLRQRLDLVVIDERRLVVEPVLDGVIQPPGEIDLGAVRQVAAFGEAHAQQRVARVQQRHAHGRIRL